MAVITRGIAGPVRAPDATALVGARYVFLLDRRDYVASTGEAVEPQAIVRTVIETGEFDSPLELWPNTLGVTGSAYLVRVKLPGERPADLVRVRLAEGASAIPLGSWLALGTPLSGDTTSIQELIDAAIAGLGTTVADASITTAKLADDSVTTAKIAAGAVGTLDLANLAVTAGKLADDAVTNAKLAPAAVGTTEIADGAVTMAKIAASLTRVIGKSGAPQNVVNTIAETAILSQALAGLAVGNALRIVLYGELRSYVTGATAGVSETVRIKYGATVIASDVWALPDAFNRRQGVRLEVELHQYAAGLVNYGVWLGATDAQNEDWRMGSDFSGGTSGEAFALDLTAANTLSVTVQHSHATVDFHFRRRGWTLELLP